MKKLLLIVPAAILIIAGGILGSYMFSVTGAQTIYGASWGNLHCVPIKTSGVTITGEIKDGSIVKCPEPSASGEYANSKTVDKCEVSIRTPKCGFMGGTWSKLNFEKCSSSTGECEQMYDALEQQCGGTAILDELSSDQYYKFKEVRFCTVVPAGFYGILSACPYKATMTYEEKFIPYKLQAEYKGSKLKDIYPGEEAEKGCTVPLTYKDDICASGDENCESTFPSELEPEHFVNYVSYWYEAPAITGGTIYNYKGNYITCAGGVYGMQSDAWIVKKEKVTFWDGSSKWIYKEDISSQADVTGNAIKIPCCPSDPWCTTNFEIIEKEDITGEQCSIWDGVTEWFVNPKNEKSIVKYSCVNGRWVAYDEKVNECADGCGVNEYCDANYNCVAVGEYESRTGEVTGSGEGIEANKEEGEICPPVWGIFPDIPCMIGTWWANYWWAVVIVGIFLIVIIMLIIALWLK